MLTQQETQLPFDEAISYFRDKLQIPAAQWDVIQDALKDYAFWVSGVTDAELLGDIYELVDRVLATGMTFDEFEQVFDQLTQVRGWQPAQGQSISRRARTIYDTNTRVAYSAGRNRQMVAVKEARPYGEWVHGDSPDFRPHHKAMDGKIFLMDDLIANNLMPSFAYGCRCRVVSHRKPPREVESIPRDRVTIRSKATGKTAEVPGLPVTVDGVTKVLPLVEPGFNYNPGLQDGAQRAIVQDMVKKLPPPFRAQLQV